MPETQIEMPSLFRPFANGGIDPGEFAAVLGTNIDPKVAQKFVQALDKDQSGALDAAEMGALVRAFDADGSGDLSQEELQPLGAMLEAAAGEGASGAPRGWGRPSEGDAIGDTLADLVAGDEYGETLKALLERLDENGDGQLSPEEVTPEKLKEAIADLAESDGAGDDAGEGWGAGWGAQPRNAGDFPSTGTASDDSGSDTGVIGADWGPHVTADGEHVMPSDFTMPSGAALDDFGAGSTP